MQNGRRMPDGANGWAAEADEATSFFKDYEEQELGDDIFDAFAEDTAKAGGPSRPPDGAVDATGWTMFDAAGSDDATLTLLLAKENIADAPSQAMVKIESHDSDGVTRQYLGIVVAGPFAEPDGMRADSPLVIATTVRGVVFTPDYHGRCQVELLGELTAEGTLVPPRYRPLPKSPVWVLDDAETAKYLNTDGDIQLGRASGHDAITVGIPSDKKSVLPRHTAILGTTGGGKSTTVSRIIGEAQKAGYAVIVLDVEGEYTHLNTPTDDAVMKIALAKRDLAPAGVANTHIYHLIGRDTANEDHPDIHSFSLKLSTLSPHTLVELADLSEAQNTRFWQAYNITRNILRKLNIFPRPAQFEEDEKLLIGLDEFEVGHPRMTLEHLYGVVVACAEVIDKSESEYYFDPQLWAGKDGGAVRAMVGEQSATLEKNVASWRALQGRLGRLRRPKVFDNPAADGINYRDLLAPGHVSIIDLSDTSAALINNLVIADILRGVQARQDDYYQEFADGKRAALPKVMIIIEEAHEFLSEERISAMPSLFEQVGRIAKRGRKRWLSLVFVTQSPSSLPKSLFGLINNYILHKVTDAGAVAMLHKTIPNVDDSLWRHLPSLAPGQAIVSFGHMTRPLLVAIDPAQAKLRMVE